MIKLDYILHFIVGIILSLLFLFFVHYFWSFLLVSLIAFGKEFYDKYVKKTRFDLWDLTSTLIGGLLPIFLKFLIS